ncbi:hypothetical protein FOA52_000743 [Chlamydomonas sp. UWO 241]|nr:hypothetical protein FOA52_000743 [Chlamydomonas sp. UWO 241]
MAPPLVMLATGLVLLLLSGVYAFTRPDQMAALNTIKDANTNRSASWVSALSSWTCPTDPADSDGTCDPCSRDWSGNWEHMHCRGAGARYGEGSTGVYDGYVTTIHVTDQNLEGPPAKEWCLLEKIRELDLDGGHASGPFPDFVLTCLTSLQELDLSHNRLTGTIPSEISKKTILQEFKMESNFFSGPLPAALGNMPDLWRIRLGDNHFTGTVPADWSKLAPTLNQLELERNYLSGNLNALADLKLMRVTVHSNAGLCGMVPASVRYASGYNAAGTRLGQPC